MGKIKIREFEYKKFFTENKEMIRLYNNIIYPKIACIGTIVTSLALLGSLFNDYMDRARWPYVVIWVICTLIYLTRKARFWRNHPRLSVYLVFFCIYTMLMYMGTVLFNNGTGASILILLTIFPVTFTDRPERLFGTDLFMYIGHTVVSFMFKDYTYATLDMINGFVATLCGCVFGFFILNSRLHALNFRTLLVAEREMDILTTLFNRRKMTEDLEAFERGLVPYPTGIIMMDIDWFKKYNDTYGHLAGDNCLSSFGKMLMQTDWGVKTKFYRYGGEEFIGFVWNADRQQIAKVAEAIHDQTKQLTVDGRNITISAGYVLCDPKKISNYEIWIQRADEALYLAKGKGRDCVAEYEETENASE